MPKQETPKLAIHLDLLKPQSNPQKLIAKFLSWLLSSGRYIFIFVEALVLIVFILRFKLDADLASNKEEIKQKIPYIQNQKTFEILVRETQLKLSTVKSFQSSYTDYTQILKKIADQTPAGIKIISINLQQDVTKVIIQLTGLAQNNNDLSSFITGLKQDPAFSNINITAISFDHGSLSFSIGAQAGTSQGGKNL